MYKFKRNNLLVGLFLCLFLIVSIFFITDGSFAGEIKSLHNNNRTLIKKHFDYIYNKKDINNQINQENYLQSCGEDGDEALLEKITFVKSDKKIFQYRLSFSRYVECDDLWEQSQCYALVNRKNRNIKFIDIKVKTEENFKAKRKRR